jgi:Aspartyl protease/PDZ domain
MIGTPKSDSSQLAKKALWILLISQCIWNMANGQPQKQNGSLLIDVEANGVAGVFMLDTGAERSVIDEIFAKKLRLNPRESGTIIGPDANSASQSVVVDQFNLQSSHLKKINMITSDLTKLAKAIGTPINGIVGADILSGFVVRLNYSDGTVLLNDPLNGTLGEKIKLIKIGNLYFVPIMVGGKSLNFLLDTGTNLSAMSSSALSRLEEAPQRTLGGIRSSSSGTDTRLACFSRVVAGRNTYINVAMRLEPKLSSGFFADESFDGLLGGDFLSQFLVDLDLAKSTVYLSPNPIFRVDKTRFSTIGIQFVKDASGSIIIMSVWGPSPAKEAGLKELDEIVAVNGESTKPMASDIFSNRIHGKAGQRVQLTLKEEGRLRIVDVDIADLLCPTSSSEMFP